MQKHKNIVILTGAGISRESGLHTFRDPDGVWAKVRIEDVATPEAFVRDPERVHEFYNQRRAQLTSGEVQPNLAHLALAQWEEAWEGNFLLVTQNIDDLHQRAGSQEVLPMHGELLKVRSSNTEEVIAWQEDLTTKTKNPLDGTLGTLRPHVVWFGEMPLEMDRIYEALQHCDLFVSIGTSGNVYPAAGFVQEAMAVGARTVEINLEPSEGATLFEEKRYGKATEEVPKFVKEILGG